MDLIVSSQLLINGIVDGDNMVVIKFEDGTYYAGCNKHNAKTLLGAQIYKSEKTAQNIINNSINFPTLASKCKIVEVELKEKI